VLKLGNQI